MTSGMSSSQLFMSSADVARAEEKVMRGDNHPPYKLCSRATVKNGKNQCAFVGTPSGCRNLHLTPIEALRYLNTKLAGATGEAAEDILRDYDLASFARVIDPARVSNAALKKVADVVIEHARYQEIDARDEKFRLVPTDDDAPITSAKFATTINEVARAARDAGKN